jgi:hypothetical protein
LSTRKPPEPRGLSGIRLTFEDLTGFVDNRKDFHAVAQNPISDAIVAVD